MNSQNTTQYLLRVRTANRIGMIFMTILLLSTLLTVPVKAISPDQRRVFDSGVYFFDVETVENGVTNCAGNINLVGNDSAEQAYNYFISRLESLGVSQGQAAVSAAGIVGNLLWESHLIPTNTNSIGAYGIAQWLGTRKDNLMKLANFDTLPVQLGYVWQELTTGYKDSVLDPLMNAHDLKTAVDIVLRHYEVPCKSQDDACWNKELYSNRLPEAISVIKQFGDGSVNPVDPTVIGCGNNDGSDGSNTITGSGSGQFTTDTDAPAYPGLAQMLAYAKSVAQPGADESATEQFCNAIGGCSFHCESAVEWVWLRHRGVYPNPYPQPPNSSSAWSVISAAGRTHLGDRNPPVGALLFYTAPGDANGHIAIYLGNNLVFSTDVLGAGKVYIASADKIESAGWNMNYVGWADPYFNGKVGYQGQ